MHFQKKLGKGVFGGEGFIMQKLSGSGTAFIEIDGHAVEYDLNDGQELLISTGYLAAMEESCTMDDIGAYIDNLNTNYFQKNMSYDDCKKLGDFIVNIVLSNEGRAMYFDGFDF